MPVDHLLPWHVYLCEHQDLPDVNQHYEEEARVQEDEEGEKEEEDFSNI